MNDENLQEFAGQPVEHIYQTGSTKPPKSRKGVLAVILMAAIFLPGILSVLHMVDVDLTEPLEELLEPETCTVSFMDLPDPASVDTPFGFHGDPVSTFWQTYQRLPQGLYITQVDDARQAAHLGICPGDILLMLDGNPVTDWEGLNHMVSGRVPGDRILLTFYRDGSHQELWLTLYE